MYDNSIMNLTALLLLSALPAAAQTSAPARSSATPAHRTTPKSSAAPACAKLPEMSSKIPALPTGTPCAKPLYTITTVPSARLDYVSPLEGTSFRETLGIEPSSFSLDFVDTKIGAGQLAGPHQWYSIHYTGYLLDGTKFDSSVDRGEPIVIQYGAHKVIPGWDTGFAGMHVGGKRRLFIPYQLAYGPQAHQSIPPKSELIFDVELVSVSDTEPKPKTPPTPPAAMPRIPPSGARPATPPAGGPPSATQPPTQPGSSQNIVGKPTSTPPASPAADPTKPTATPPSSTTPPPATPPKP